jgi:hypothetical protein
VFLGYIIFGLEQQVLKFKFSIDELDVLSVPELYAQANFYSV